MNIDEIFRNSSKSLMWLLLGILLLVTNTITYLTDSSYSSYYIPLIFVSLMLIITAVFEFRKYNKTLYMAIVTVVLVIMWIVSFIQPLSPSVDKIIYYIEIGIITLGIVSVLIDPRKWKNMKKH